MDDPTLLPPLLHRPPQADCERGPVDWQHKEIECVLRGAGGTQVANKIEEGEKCLPIKDQTKASVGCACLRMNDSIE